MAAAERAGRVHAVTGPAAPTPLPGDGASESRFHDLGRRLPIAAQLSLRVRRRMFDRFIERMAPTAGSTILDLGVTGERASPEANYLERWYPYKHRIVAAGVEDASHLERCYPGLVFMPIRAHERLPFADGAFDIVFSNAVVEHAGSRTQQRAFVDEALRVATRFFITTPNRWFPIEMHTALPLVHYLPAPLNRRLLSALGHRFWASEDRLNLLDARSLRGLFAGHNVAIDVVRLGGLASNLIAYGEAGTSRC